MRTVDVRGPGIRGKIEISTEPLGKGGEGSVFTVGEHSVENLPDGSKLVAKIYHEPEDGNRKNKIVSMISSPPEIDDALAWPIAIVADNGRFLGYLMTKLDSKSYRPWLEVAHSSTRRKKAPDFSSQYALYAVRNLAESLKSIHEAGHMVGDINESNIFVSSEASVMIVDTDSAQIRSPQGDVFPCIVGKPEYTSPELSHGSLRDQLRTPESDAFAFGVAVFQILTGGAHPADGIFKKDDDPPSMTEKMREGVFPGIGKTTRDFAPVPRIASKGIPSRILELLKGLLEADPEKRTDVSESIAVFDDVLDNLQQCKKVKTHFYDKRDKSCGWCEHAKTQPDPWSNDKPKVKGKSMAQKKLPGVNFQETKAPPKKAPRSRVSTASTGSSYPQQSSYAPSAPRRALPSRTSNTSVPSQSFSNQQTQVGTNSNAANLFQGANSGSAAQQQPPQIPDKIKGKMTVTYVDGSYGPRPSFMALAEAGKWGVIKKAIGVEYPSSLKFWWPVNRDAPNGIGLLIGLVLGLVAAYSWIPLGMWVTQEFPANQIAQVGAPLYSLIAFLTGGSMVLITSIFSLVAFVKMKMRNLLKENFLKTSVRFPLIGFVYGAFPLVAAVFILLAVAKFLIDVISNGR